MKGSIRTSCFSVALLTLMNTALLICSKRMICRVLRGLGCILLIPFIRTTKASLASSGTKKLPWVLASRLRRISSRSLARYSLMYDSARLKMAWRCFLAAYRRQTDPESAQSSNPVQTKSAHRCDPRRSKQAGNGSADTEPPRFASTAVPPPRPRSVPKDGIIRDNIALRLVTVPMACRHSAASVELTAHFQPPESSVDPANVRFRAIRYTPGASPEPWRQPRPGSSRRPSSS